MLNTFIDEVITAHKSGAATEHSYRPALERLFSGIHTKVRAINEPKREKVGAPDFVFRRGDIVIGHCEAKDLHIDLKKMKGANADQKKRYTGGLSNLIYTNCLEWIFYRDGEIISEIKIADYQDGVQPIPRKYNALEQMLRDFTLQKPQTITSPKRLAERMAGKAILIKDVLANALLQDEEHKTELYGQYTAFKDNLLHNITIGEFADLYSETIAYGMFAARLHDPTPQDFSRQEALELLPKSNPFLRNLFSYIAGPNLDERISWVIDDLAEIFQACNVKDIMHEYGSTTQRNDPFLHFYETFLAAYNPKKRKARGVWYTPEPVVNFIVRAVDDVLKTEFGLKDGLADTSKVTIDWDTGQTGLRKDNKPLKLKKTNKEKREVHRVQILDPATGTGTFLAETIKQIAPRIKAPAPAMWSSYVEKDLIPRMHGFELLMASYAMCHMKLDMVLTDLGYEPSKKPPRLSVYLTDSLEESQPDQRDLLMARWLSDEARGANEVKRDQPIMCVIGNPPYSGESANIGDWIMSLMEAYKKEPGGIEKLKERNPKWINDDYVKFIRLSEHMIEKNGEGILGFITNHGYLDNPTFRGMRWHLLKTFDKVYVMDLHGNSKKKEVSPDGSPDKNVFDIQQGVAIIIAVKTMPTIEGKKNKKGTDIPLAEVYHSELWGDRKGKYEALWNANILSKGFSKLNLHEKYYMFYPIDNALLDEYDQSFSVSDLFSERQIGLTTSRDNLAVAFDENSIQTVIKDLVDFSVDDTEIRRRYFPDKKKKGNIEAGDSKTWKLSIARQIFARENVLDCIKPIAYRPFDSRRVLYTDTILERSRREIIPQMFCDNICISFNRKIDEERLFTDIFVFREPVQLHSLSLKESNYFAPLYLYPDEKAHKDEKRRVNFDEKLYNKLRGIAKDKDRGEPDEIAVFDYIYGTLHCPAYRETYAEFLRIDFPRIPWPKSPLVFWSVSDKGGDLRRLHLMEDEAIGETPFPFQTEEGEDGDNIVDKPTFKDGRVYINKTQYFDCVPEISWDFYIGGYQPAQKWLKDRKGRELSFDDIRHYQKIIKILSETDRIMRTIEMPLQ